MVIRKCDITMDDALYTLIKQQLIVRPKGFYCHAIPRARSSSPIAVAPTGPLAGSSQVSQGARTGTESGVEAKHKLHVAYGLNTGTS